MNMDRPYLLVVEYPFSWREGWTVRFETEEERQTYAAELRSEKNAEWATEEYLLMGFATLTEVLR